MSRLPGRLRRSTALFFAGRSTDQNKIVNRDSIRQKPTNCCIPGPGSCEDWAGCQIIRCFGIQIPDTDRFGTGLTGITANLLAEEILSHMSPYRTS